MEYFHANGIDQCVLEANYSLTMIAESFVSYSVINPSASGSHRSPGRPPRWTMLSLLFTLVYRRRPLLNWMCPISSRSFAPASLTWTMSMRELHRMHRWPSASCVIMRCTWNPSGLCVAFFTCHHQLTTFIHRNFEIYSQPLS